MLMFHTRVKERQMIGPTSDVSDSGPAAVLTHLITCFVYIMYPTMLLAFKHTYLISALD